VETSVLDTPTRFSVPASAGIGKISARDRAEETLVAGLIHGNKNQVGIFLHRTHRPVYAMAARLTTDPDLRHDWSQDVLLRILQEMKKGNFVYRRPGCFWAWFQMRANFLLINFFQQHHKQNERLTMGEAGTALAEKIPWTRQRDPLRLMEEIEARHLVEMCLDELPSDDQRRALHLLLFQDLTYREIARTMDASLNTVRSWILRGRITMRRKLAEKMDI